MGLWEILLKNLFVVACAFAAVPVISQNVSPTAAPVAVPIVANDNRVPSGLLKDGVLTLSLELRKGNWHPEREDGDAIPAYAFCESGKPLQVPGPAIRVPQGTTIDVTLRSFIGVPATVHGLHARPGKDSDVVTVAAGGSAHVRFAAGAPGTYLYWARTPDGRRGNNRGLDALLGAALVVDPPGSPANDRIFVFERWNGPTRTAINGKSWPYTERLNLKVGEKVHWKLVNASDLSHPMHLHGFHFSLDAEGDGENYKVFDDGMKPEEFTHTVEVMQTFEMTWSPSEPGRWLYHCHRIPHMQLPVALDPADVLATEPSTHDHEHMHDMTSDYSGMGGMIIGITVTGKSAIDTVNNWNPTHKIEISVGTQKGEAHAYEISLKDAGEAKPALSTGLTGPVLVVTEGEKTEIAITNTMNEPTAIHWHGMEIESYYDGVPWWGGIDDKRAPAVEPGKTFTVRMIPLRAGTFIYHTHWHDAAQLTGGIHGAMIVLAPGQKYDPDTDKSFLFSIGPNQPYGAGLLLLNGSPQPAALHLRTGRTYRFRLINITPATDNLQVSLRDENGLVTWRELAKDAFDVKKEAPRKADQRVAISETFDFEYRADKAGEVTLQGWPTGNARRVIQTLIFADQ